MNKKIFFAVLLLSLSFLRAQDVIQKGNIYYLSNTVVVKLKETAVNNAQALKRSLAKYPVREAVQMYPQNGTLKKGEALLSRTYLVQVDSKEDPAGLAKKISKQSNIEWAEPKYVYRLTYSPNDSLYVLKQQQYLKRVFADSAWNVTKGDSKVIIGIIDTGVDWNHPDLKANILKDSNGNMIGYDFGGLDGTPDNDPTEDYSALNRYHGTHVAGIADAVSDNKIGVASIGYGCSILPVKVTRDDKRDAAGYPYIYFGFEGIKYAVDHGAKVINCSWGGYSYSLYEQSVIDYAVTNGALVVASNGNDGISTPFYPASYNGVLSVGWLSSSSDLIFPDGNYGRTVKVFAPGTSIFSTWQRQPGSNQLYNAISGSSMSAPIVSGLAGLVFAKFPNYKPLQVEEQIRVTADNIDAVNADSLKLLLGSGRINAYNAVTRTNATSIRAGNVTFVDQGNKNGLLESGEDVSVKINFTNFLSPVANATVTLQTSDNSVVITNSTFNTGSMATLSTVSDQSNEFKFTIQQNAPFNHDVNFLLTYSANGYSDFQWIHARINPTYGTHNVGNIMISVTSKGTLGFNDYPQNLEGDGFKFQGGDNLMFEGAFMYGTGPTKVMNDARVSDSQNEDFATLIPIKINTTSTSQRGYAEFSDAHAQGNALGITTKYSTYSYAQAPDNNYIILNSELYNSTQKNITGLYAGYFIDWDIPANDYAGDTTYFDQTDNFAVAYEKSKQMTGTIVGAALISTASYGYYAIDNTATTGDVIMGDANGFSNAEKWFALSNGIKNKSAGVSDISLVVSGGPFNIPSKQSINVGFAIAAGSTIDELKQAVRQSKEKYKTLFGWIPGVTPTSITLYQNYPNPFNSTTNINYYLPQSGQVSIKLYDILGREISTLINEVQDAGYHRIPFTSESMHLASGVYFYRMVSGSFSETKKMIILK